MTVDGPERIMEDEELEQLLARRIRRVPEGIIQDACMFRLALARATWQESPIVLQPGDRVTGMMLPPASAGIPPCEGGPGLLWMRIGKEGGLLGGTGSTHSFVAETCGTLELAGTQGGRPAEAARDAASSRHLPVVVFRWNTTVLRGLRHLADAGDLQGMARSEIARLCGPAEDASRGSQPTTEAPGRCRRP